MKQYFLDRIFDYLLDRLDDEDRRIMEKVLAQSPALAREALRMKEALAMRASLLYPLPAPPGGRARLLSALDSSERFRIFLGSLCEVVDLPEDVMRRHLARVDDIAAWQVGPVPGLYLTHFQPGPRLSSVDVDAGFVRVVAGHAIPRHRHLGPEVALVLEGTLWEDGIAYLPGRLVERSAGSVHGFKAGSERDLLFAVTHSGVEIV